METIHDTLKFDFGSIEISTEQQEFYFMINNSILELCKKLPESIQSDILFFIMDYAGVRGIQNFDIFSKYFVPAWSFPFWIIDKSLHSKKFNRPVAVALAMAMFLHSLDDHLHDGDIKTTHQLLLLRSEAWILYKKSLHSIAITDDMNGLIKKRINDYYCVISNDNELPSIHDYCNQFRNQMATWTVISELLIQYNNYISNDICLAYESFGIAWRLLDDLNDIEVDYLSSTKSAVYYLLNDEQKEFWVANQKDLKKAKEIIARNDIVNQLVILTINELTNAAQISEFYNLNEMSNEFISMAEPLYHCYA